jgi:hypothetical protein
MTGLIKQLAIATSVAVGMTAIGSASALAGSFTGSVSGPNLYYGFDGTNTYHGGTNVNTVTLTGDSTTPGNNIELGGTTQHTSTADFLNASTLSGMIGGQSITLSSMTATDWFGADLNQSFGANNFANQWFNAALNAYNFDSVVAAAAAQGTTLTRSSLFTTFLNGGGFARASDPNISYINQENNQVKIGLAGHFTLNTDINNFLTLQGLGSFTQFVPQNVQLSEVVKVTYGGETGYFSSLFATGSGLFDLADLRSHNGNYEITLAARPGNNDVSVPEPSTMLALMAIGGLFGTAKRKSAKNA